MSLVSELFNEIKNIIKEVNVKKPITNEIGNTVKIPIKKSTTYLKIIDKTQLKENQTEINIDDDCEKNMFILRIEDASKIFPYYDNSKINVCKMCDYIIFYIANHDNLYVFMVELKSDNSRGFEQQLQAGNNFAQFIVNTSVRVLHSKNKMLYLEKNINIEYRGILVSKKVYKNTTKPRQLYEKKAFTLPYTKHTSSPDQINLEYFAKK
jgi:hypothetical protein